MSFTYIIFLTLCSITQHSVIHPSIHPSITHSTQAPPHDVQQAHGGEWPFDGEWLKPRCKHPRCKQDASQQVLAGPVVASKQRLTLLPTANQTTKTKPKPINQSINHKLPTC
jgi:hypothetical protein